jgi:hypothetical protein
LELECLVDPNRTKIMITPATELAFKFLSQDTYRTKVLLVREIQIESLKHAADLVLHSAGYNEPELAAKILKEAGRIQSQPIPE